MSRQGNRIQLANLLGWLSWLLMVSAACSGSQMAWAEQTVPPASLVDTNGVLWQVEHRPEQSMLIRQTLAHLSAIQQQSASQTQTTTQTQPTRQTQPTGQTQLARQTLQTHTPPYADPRQRSALTATTRLALDTDGRMYVAWVTPALAALPAQLVLTRIETASAAQPPKPALLVLPLPSLGAGCTALPQLAVHGQQVLLAWAAHCQEQAAIPAAQALYVVFSEDAGAHFSPPQSLAESRVVCGEIAITPHPTQGFALLWRQAFSATESDLVMTTIARKSQAQAAGTVQSMPMVRASFGHAASISCAAPSMHVVVGEGFGYHLSYVEPGGKNPGLKRVRMDGDAWVTSPAVSVMDATQTADLPQLLSHGDRVWLCWRTHTGNSDAAMCTESADGGRTWESPVVRDTAPAIAALQVLLLNGQPQLWVDHQPQPATLQPL